MKIENVYEALFIHPKYVYLHVNGRVFVVLHYFDFSLENAEDISSWKIHEVNHIFHFPNMVHRRIQTTQCRNGKGKTNDGVVVRSDVVKPSMVVYRMADEINNILEKVEHFFIA